jgi:hypothetical protein
MGIAEPVLAAVMFAETVVAVIFSWATWLD